MYIVSFKSLSHREERMLLHGTITEMACSQSGLPIILNGNINLKGEEQEKQVEWEITQCGTNYGSLTFQGKSKYLVGVSYME